MIVLSNADVAALLPMEDAIEVVERAMVAVSAGKANLPFAVVTALAAGLVLSGWAVAAGSRYAPPALASEQAAAQVLKAHHAESVSISAAQHDGLDRLEAAVRDALSDRALEAEIETGVENGRVLAYLAQHAQIHDRTYSDDRVRLHCHLPRRCLEFLSENGVSVRSNGQLSRMGH